MHLRTTRNFCFWVFVAVLSGTLAGFELSLTIMYIVQRVDLLDLRYINAPAIATLMLLWAVNAGLRLVKSYRDALSMSGQEAVAQRP